MNKLTKTLSTLGLSTALLLSSIGAASASEVHYKDVSKNDNFYKSVEYLLDQNAISRTLPNFRPYENITRGQMASITAKVMNIEGSNYKPNLEDVTQDHQFYPYIADVMSNGIMRGYAYKNYDYTKREFGVNDPLTRGQFAGMILKAYEIPLITARNYIEHGGKVSDIFDGTKFKGTWGQHIATLEVLGYISGYGDGNFKQNSPIKRSQFANMLTKAVGSRDTELYIRLINRFKILGVSEEVATEKVDSLKNSEVMDIVNMYEAYDGWERGYYKEAVIDVKKEGEILFEDINMKMTVTRSQDLPDKYNYVVERIAED